MTSDHPNDSQTPLQMLDCKTSDPFKFDLHEGDLKHTFVLASARQGMGAVSNISPSLIAMEAMRDSRKVLMPDENPGQPLRFGWRKHNLTERNIQRVQFEQHAATLGFDLTHCECAAPEPWSEYACESTGYLWAGWLARAGIE